MDIIKRRINSPYYKSVQEFQNDFELMFKNAMTYNVEGSDVYSDAVFLKSLLLSSLTKKRKTSDDEELETQNKEPRLD
jgi:ATP-dependent helicase STH1/SNF2